MTNDIAINKFHQLIHQLSYNETIEDIEFAMWWASEDDPFFTKSVITDNWIKIYEITKHIQSYVAADLLRHLGLVENDINRMMLPDKIDSISILTNDNIKLIISFSREKGIRFHFSEYTPYEYQLNFLDSFIDYCLTMKKRVELNKWETDADSGSSDWWEATIRTSIIIEKNGQLDVVGKIF